MIDVQQVYCPVCESNHNRHYISTNALMHKKNEEHYSFNKCLKCDSVFLANPVEESELKNYYTDNYLPYKGAEAWGKFSAFVTKNQEKLDRNRTQLVARNAPKNKSFAILDVGCGNPSFLRIVQDKLPATCTGIDFSDNGWRNKNYDSLQLITTSIAHFQPIQLFDVITLWHYLEHDYQLRETTEKLYDLLHPTGRLIIEVPDYQSVTARQQEQFWQGWHSPRHLTLFSKKGIQTLFDSEKWRIVKHKRYGTLDAFTLWWLGRMEKKNKEWSSSMESEFWKLVFLKLITFPLFVFEKIIPMGVQTIVVEKRQTAQQLPIN